MKERPRERVFQLLQESNRGYCYYYCFFFALDYRLRTSGVLSYFFTKSPSMYTGAPSPEKKIFLREGASVHRQRKSNLNRNFLQPFTSPSFQRLYF